VANAARLSVCERVVRGDAAVLAAHRRSHLAADFAARTGPLLCAIACRRRESTHLQRLRAVLWNHAVYALICLHQNEPSVDLDSISFARTSRSRSSIAGVIVLRASLPATNSFGGFCIAAILTSASPSFAGSPGCVP